MYSFINFKMCFTTESNLLIKNNEILKICEKKTIRLK